MRLLSRVHFRWRDERVRQELVALGFESPGQMGSLFMADARDLAAFTADIPPVTDNYPLRISDRLVRIPGREPLYGFVMDERERLKRFERSAYIERIWPRELARASLPFFRYEGMIKEYFTNGLYPDARKPPRWEALDDVLTNTTLEALPLWLLGTDHDVQRIAKAAADRGQPSAAIELQLAAGKLARRDYAGALEHTQRSLTDGQIGVGNLSVLLYALAKSGHLEEARTLIASIDTSRTPEIKTFLDWFEVKFRLREVSSLRPERHTQHRPQRPRRDR